VGKQSHGKLIAYLPLVVLATFAVVAAPMLLVSWLRESGVVDSAWTAMAVGVVSSLLISQGGAAIWKRHDSEALFSELMLWGWVRRWRSERRLTAASDLLGLNAGSPKAISGGKLTNGQKSSLLTQLTSSLEARDQYTHGHSRRVARHAANIAKQMGLGREEVTKIRAAGAMHDVGKVETPVAVLHKEGKLTDEEYAIVKRHPVDGANMVATLDDDELSAIVRHHHERLDGTGYPDGLAGDEIPLGARILAVADTFDAITSTRPYRHSNPHKKALDILAAEAGTQLDPDAVRAFRSCYSGRRPLAYWTILVNGGPRLASLFGGSLSPANAASVAATTATAAVVGVAAMAPVAAPAQSPPPEPPQRVAAAGASPSAPTGRPTSRHPVARPNAMASLSPERRADYAAKAGNHKSTVAGGGHGGASVRRIVAAPNADATETTQPPVQAPSPVVVAHDQTVSSKRNPRGNRKGRELAAFSGPSTPKGPGYGYVKNGGPDNSPGGSPGSVNGRGNGKGHGHGHGKAHGHGHGHGHHGGESPRLGLRDGVKHDRHGERRSGPR